MNDTAPKKPASKWRIALFGLMVVVGGIVGLLVVQNRAGREAELKGKTETAEAESGPQLTPEQCREAIELKDVAIGNLENGPTEVEVSGKKVSGLKAAAEAFEHLAGILPTERLPLRNLAISRLLVLQSAQENQQQAREEARAAAKRLLDADGGSAVANWIAATVELYQDASNPMGAEGEAREKAVAMLDRATQLDPDNAIFWFALFRGVTSPRDTEPSVQAVTALGKAYAANPRNIYLVTEWLVTQTKVKDPAIEQTLAAAKAVLAPVTAAVKRRGIDIGPILERALEAAKAGNWNVVNSSVRMVQNVVRPEEVAKSDITRVDVHPLEFVLYDFSLEFYAGHDIPTPPWSESTPVKLVVSPENSLPDLANVTDLLIRDFDLDGLPDLIVLQPNKLSVYGCAKLGESWSLLTALDVPEGMTGLMAADLDRDTRKATAAPSPAGGDGANSSVKFNRVLSGTATCYEADPDIVVFGDAGVLVVRNDSEVTGDAPKLVVVANEELGQLTKVAQGVLVDVDQDADLDLVLSSAQGITLWEAGGKLSYTNISEWSTLPPADVAATALVAVDWDRDVDIDIVLAGPGGDVVGLLENQRHAEFRWTPFDDSFEQLGRPDALALLEADGNLSWDLLSAGERGVRLFLTATPRPGTVKLLRAESITDQAQVGVLAWDFDNDGYRDAACWGAAGLQLFRGGPAGSYRAAAVLEGELAEPVDVARTADLDRDGDQDLVVVTKGGVVGVLNDGASANGWVTLYPMGQEDNKGRCNHDAIGSMVELRSGGWYQAQVVDAPTIHFGLGDRKQAEQVRIIWTNGVPQDIVGLDGNVAVCERMVLKGSCPFVYTMAHGEFTFLTDCLWAAPLGLQTAEGGVAPTRPWEYLRIPGERLTPQDGSYWIKLTEELWEAGYFDKVQLIAVDHPADVDIYSNEKVGPPDISEFKIHTVRNRRYPDRAVDPRGNDISRQLRQQDGDFVKAFPQRIRQGLAPEHYIELYLGDLQNPRRITLFLTGWIFPTDTSLNVAFRQDPETDGPRMPSVWVIDAHGEWKEAIATMGFPGGKTKTIAVDLSHAFLTDDYRVRIKTTAEIYWDEAFYTVDEPEVEVRQIPLVCESAELEYRGFSQELPPADNAPQLYNHSVVSRAPAWPPMRGKFTRYGSVRELLLEGDDRMAVLAAGDAITVRFAVPERKPPDGWKRDFILHSIGWDKDADLNTIYGQTVEPLPFRAMKSYPYGWDESVPDSATYHDYLRRYQTREQDQNAFWRVLRP